MDTASQSHLLRPWGLGPVVSVAAPAAGTVNRTLMVTTAAGRYALRTYRHADRAPVAREHAIIAHVRGHGLPAVAPLPLVGGGAILARDGRYHALFPIATGRQFPKHALGPREAAAMGVDLGALHRALADLPAVWHAQRDFALDRDATLAGIARLEAAIRGRPARGDADAPALRWLAGQRAWLDTCPPGARIDLSALPQQVIHGDYQENNLFLAGGRVSAIIDWDQTYRAPRAWEVLRAMHLAFAFAPDRCRAFLSAYRGVLPLPRADLDRAAAAYALKVGYDLWALESYYLRGEVRVAPFLPVRPFASPADGWARLRADLSP